MFMIGIRIICLFLLPILIVFLFVSLILVLKVLWELKFYKMIIIIIFTVIIFFVFFIQTDFIKSRKAINENKIIGKNEQIIKLLYCCCDNNNDQNKNVNENNQYDFYIREIIKYDFVNSKLAEKRYYVTTDYEGIITDIKVVLYGDFDIPPSEYSYWDRWGF